MADETNNCLTVLHFCASISLSLLSNMIVNDDEQRLTSFVLYICISLCQFSPTLYRKLERLSKKIEGSTGKNNKFSENTAMLYIKQRWIFLCVCVNFFFFESWHTAEKQK